MPADGEVRCQADRASMIPSGDQPPPEIFAESLQTFPNLFIVRSEKGHETRHSRGVEPLASLPLTAGENVEVQTPTLKLKDQHSGTERLSRRGIFPRRDYQSPGRFGGSHR